MLNKYVLLAVLVFLTSCTATTNHKPATESVPESSTPSEFHQPKAEVVLPNSPIDPVNTKENMTALDDVWVRIQQQISINVADRPEIAAERKFYSRQQKFLNDVANRADPFLYYVVTRLEQRGMPVELALIPIVESAYNPIAKGAGPSGLWQMVPQTAKNFGLKINYWYDGRNDAVASTEAVLDLLQYLHDNLENDWINAVAAYNSGEARIQNAIIRNKAKGKPTDFYSLNIPVKFTRTVPKWLALVDIVKNPARHQVKLKPIANKPKFQMAKIPGPVDLAQAAQANGMSLAELKRFNTGFKRHASSPDGPHQLAIPVEHFAQFDSKSLKVQKLVAGQSYKIKKGDTLGSVAAKFGISVSKLKKQNNLKTESLTVGKTLQIPPEAETAKSKTNSSYKVRKGDNLWTISKKLKIDSEQLRVANHLAVGAELKPGQILKIPSASQLAKKSSNKSKSSTKNGLYTVQSGDSLDKIARKYKVKISDLMKWNDLKKSYMLKPGMQLKVSGSGSKS
jgi:LysM repeat protein/soluble lytic murein transglycosylase-like protein